MQAVMKMGLVMVVIVMVAMAMEMAMVMAMVMVMVMFLPMQIFGLRENHSNQQIFETSTVIMSSSRIMH